MKVQSNFLSLPISICLIFGLWPFKKTLGSVTSNESPYITDARVTSLFEKGQAGGGHGFGPSHFKRVFLNLDLLLSDSSSIHYNLQKYFTIGGVDKQLIKLLSTKYKIKISPNGKSIALSKEGSESWIVGHLFEDNQLLLCQHIFTQLKEADIFDHLPNARTIVLKVLQDSQKNIPSHLIERDGNSEIYTSLLFASLYPEDEELSQVLVEFFLKADIGISDEEYVLLLGNMGNVLTNHPKVYNILINSLHSNISRERSLATILLSFALKNTPNDEHQKNLISVIREEITNREKIGLEIFDMVDIVLLDNRALFHGMWALASIANATNDISDDLLALAKKIGTLSNDYTKWSTPYKAETQAYAILIIAATKKEKPLLIEIAKGENEKKEAYVLLWNDEWKVPMVKVFTNPRNDCRSKTSYSTDYRVAPPSIWAREVLKNYK